jgi:hypothetical protein
MIPNLPDKGYLAGSLDFSPEQWTAIREDQKRWLVAIKASRELELKPEKIKAWLMRLAAGEYRDDMRRRMAVLYRKGALNGNLQRV